MVGAERACQDICYARFDMRSYHSLEKGTFKARDDVKLRQKSLVVKCWARAPGHGAC